MVQYIMFPISDGESQKNLSIKQFVICALYD